MFTRLSSHQLITDYVTGKSVIDIGPEANRQEVEKYLVDQKGYARKDIIVDMELSLEINGEPYQTRLDLVVRTEAGPCMVIKCVAGSLDSREREVVYAARVALEKPIPIAVASDGRNALVFDAISRRQIGEGLQVIPSPDDAIRLAAAAAEVASVPQDRKEKEKIIFRSYDMTNRVDESC